jgi:RNA polymerase sigma factor (sigma-70 family)
MAISDLDYADDSDVALIRRTRMGDVDAFGILHQRHAASAKAVAWRMSRSGADADDLVSEGFARVLSALQRGAGPDVAFRPYLLSTIRRLAYDRTDRERREAPVVVNREEPATPEPDPVIDGFEREAAAAAFAALPERWRMVLWHTEVEGQKPAQVAALLGIKPNAVAALAYRAREGLRQAYLAQHNAKGKPTSPECAFVTGRLAAHLRGSLPAQVAARVEAHLETCESCPTAYLELADVNASLRGLVALAVLGPLAGHYLGDAVARSSGASATGLRRRPSASSRSGSRGGRSQAVGRSRDLVRSLAVGVVGAALVAGTWSGGGRPLGPQARQAAARHRDPAAGTAGPTAEQPSTPASSTPAPPTYAPATSGPSSTPASLPITPRARPKADPLDPPAASSTSPTSPVVHAHHLGVPPATTIPTVRPDRPRPPSRPALPPVAPILGDLGVRLQPAGSLLAGRPGMVSVAVEEGGRAAVPGVRVDVTLTGATVRRLPDQPGWACVRRGTEQISCRAPDLAAGAGRAVYLPIDVSSTVGHVTVDAVASAPGAAVDPARTTAHLDQALATSGMAARFATVDHGDVVAVGNGLLTCPDEEASCADARNRVGTRLDDDDHAMVPIDVDADPTTANSSAAMLTLPGDAVVLSADLRWGADLEAGADGAPAPRPDLAGVATLAAPGLAGAAVQAERVDRIGSRYQAVADVTGAVRNGRSGWWTLGGVQAATGHGTYAGWSLTVVYRSASAPLRSLVVLDGLNAIEPGAGPLTFSVGGFVVPVSGTAHAAVTAVSYEGDAGLTGDQLTVGSVGLADAANPAGNSFNASVSDLGSGGGLRSPAAPNLFGFDLDRFDVGRALGPGATSADITFSTDRDRYLAGALAFSVDQ